MRHQIVLAPEAADDYARLSDRDRASVRSALETCLRQKPAKMTGNRVRKLRGLRKPRYRLRVPGLRVFYDVALGEADVLAIVEASNSAVWLDRSREKA